MNRFLVTGCAGFIGSHTVEALLRQGHTVLGLDNFRTGREENLSEVRKAGNFHFMELDVTDRDRLFEAVAGFRPDAVIHLAALVSVPESFEKPELNQRLNVEATRWVAEAAREGGVKRFVFASSAAVYGDSNLLPLREDLRGTPLSPYGAAKQASEDILMEAASLSPVACHCLRYFNVYGPRQDPGSPYSGVITRFIAKATAGEKLTIFGDGEQSRDFVHVRDVAHANALAAADSSSASAIMNVCTGRGTTLNDLAAVLQRCTGRMPGVNHEPARGGDIRHSCGDPTQARTRLGFAAREQLEPALAEFTSYTEFSKS